MSVVRAVTTFYFSISHSVSVSPTSARVSHSGMQACLARARRWSFTQFFGEIEILLLTNSGALVVSYSPFFSLSQLSSLLSYRERYLRSAINPPPGQPAHCTQRNLPILQVRPRVM